MERNNRLVVDARFLTEQKAGVARYIENILHHCRDTNLEILLVSNTEINTELSFDKKIYNLFKFVPGSIFVAYILPFLLRRDDIFWGTCHVTTFFRQKSILTIHDLVSIRYPYTLNWQNRLMNKLFLKKSIEKSTILCAVSNFTKEELISITNKKVYVVRNSVNKKLFNYNPSNVGKNYILSLSTIEPRKNLTQLLKAFEKIKTNNDYNGKLFLVGYKGWLSENEFKNLSDMKDVVYLGYLPDEKLQGLYSNCDLFVYPSLYEGFGIPPLEAHVSGAKVVCTTNSEIPNLNLNNTWLYNPVEDDLSKIILKGLNVKIKSKPNYKGSWELEAEKFKSLINECFNRC